MIGIDTNIMLRVLLDEDPIQSLQARKLLSNLSESNPGYVSVTVLSEIYWVLFNRYNVPKAELILTIRTMLNLPAFEFESFEAVLRALDRFANANVDFPDVLLVERNLDFGCSKTYTFDKKAASRIPGMELLE
jgi:predicted nucleic-acid-binding protein